MIFILSVLLFSPIVDSRETFLDGKAIADVHIEKFKKPDGTSHNLIILKEPNAGDMTKEDFLLLIPELIQRALSLGMEKLPVYLVRDGIDKKEFIQTVIQKNGLFLEHNSTEIDVEETKISGFPVKK